MDSFGEELKERKWADDDQLIFECEKLGDVTEKVGRPIYEGGEDNARFLPEGQDEQTPAGAH